MPRAQGCAGAACVSFAQGLKKVLRDLGGPKPITYQNLTLKAFETGIPSRSMLFCANGKQKQNHHDSSPRTWNPQSRVLAVREI